ncbi:MAG: serine protease [Gammaproteobacteria bacterium]|jgi:hypothetical protein
MPRCLCLRGVVGTAIGQDDEGQAVLVVYVERPTVRGIPAQVDGVEVSKRVTGRFYALKNPCSGPPDQRPAGCFSDPEPGIDPTGRFDRPVPIGVSTGHPDITAGTIGARVTDYSHSNVYALRNNHVYANSNDASTGDPVLQPGPYDGGAAPADTIGTLYAFVPLTFGGSSANTIDAAVAITTVADSDNATPTDGYGRPDSTTAGVSIGDPVQKYGRTTGLTSGTVSELNAMVDVCYDSRGLICLKYAHFVNQIAISDGSFSAGGDSGSLIVSNDGNNAPVGLLFAGSSTRTLANPIDDVLEAFRVSIDGK